MRTLFAEINAVTENAATPTYTNPDDMIQALQDYILASFWDSKTTAQTKRDLTTLTPPLMAITGDTKDYTMGGSEILQASLGALIEEYNDIFSHSVKGRSMEVPNGIFSRHGGMGNEPQ